MEIFLIIVGAVVLAVVVYFWQTKRIRSVMKEENKIRVHEKDSFDLEPEDKRVEIKVGFWQAVKIGFGIAFGAFLFSLIIFALWAILWGAAVIGFLHPFSL